MRDLLRAHNLETVHLVNGSYGVDSGLGIWLKSLEIKEPLKVHTKELNSQSQVMQKNIQKIEDALNRRLEKVLRPVNKSPQRTRGDAAKSETDKADSEYAEPEEDKDGQDPDQAYSEPVKPPEEDRTSLGPDDPEFMGWLKQFGGRKRRGVDTAPHPQPLIPRKND